MGPKSGSIHPTARTWRQWSIPPDTLVAGLQPYLLRKMHARPKMALTWAHTIIWRFNIPLSGIQLWMKEMMTWKPALLTLQSELIKQSVTYSKDASVHRLNAHTRLYGKTWGLIKCHTVTEFRGYSVSSHWKFRAESTNGRSANTKLFGAKPWAKGESILNIQITVCLRHLRIYLNPTAPYLLS